jgi:hypothetical protein
MVRVLAIIVIFLVVKGLFLYLCSFLLILPLERVVYQPQESFRFISKVAVLSDLVRISAFCCADSMY